MITEEFLVDEIKEYIYALEAQIEDIVENEGSRVPLFDDGKLCAYSRVVGELEYIMRDYAGRKEGKAE